MATAKKKPARSSAKADANGVEWPFGKNNYIIFGAALVVLGIGYITLAAGSITLSPILLVLGYCVLIPLAIIYRGRPESEGSEQYQPEPVRTDSDDSDSDQTDTRK